MHPLGAFFVLNRVDFRFELPTHLVSGRGRKKPKVIGFFQRRLRFC